MVEPDLISDYDLLLVSPNGQSTHSKLQVNEETDSLILEYGETRLEARYDKFRNMGRLGVDFLDEG